MIIDNGHISVEVLPQFGARIWSLCARDSSRNWIWQNPRVVPANFPIGANYDDNWAGGWEELFPNDAKEHFMGRDLPDHGEWWSQSWSPEMSLECPVSKTSCRKQVSLAPDKPELHIRYRIENRNDEPLFYLFKQHLPIAIEPGDRIELPGGEAIRVANESERYAWRDVAVPPPDSRLHEFVYVRDLPEGWCGVFDPKTGMRLRLYFDLHQFPFTWLFMTFGGWRDLYTVVLEPCTNMPKSLNNAYERGTCARLGARETVEYSVRLEVEQ